MVETTAASDQGIPVTPATSDQGMPVTRATSDQGMPVTPATRAAPVIRATLTPAGRATLALLDIPATLAIRPSRRLQLSPDPTRSRPIR